MKKKTLLLATTAACTSFAMLAVALSTGSSFSALFAKNRDIRKHLIEFEVSDIDYLNDEAYYYLYLSKGDAFEDTEGTPYGFETIFDEEATYFYYGGSSTVKVGETYFLSFQASEYDCLRFEFKIKGASITDNTYYTTSILTQDDEDSDPYYAHYETIHFTYLNTDEDGYDHYFSWQDFYGVDDDYFVLDSFQVEFACD